MELRGQRYSRELSRVTPLRKKQRSKGTHHRSRPTRFRSLDGNGCWPLEPDEERRGEEYQRAQGRRPMSWYLDQRLTSQDREQHLAPECRRHSQEHYSGPEPER